MTQTTTRNPHAPEVTERHAPGSTGADQNPPAAAPEADLDWFDTPADVGESVTRRDRIAGLVGRAKAYWRLPAPLSDAPPTFAQVVTYARRGKWTTSPYHPRGATAKDPHTGKEIRVRSGFLRRLAGVWAHLVFLPAAFVFAYARWIVERPGRGVAVYVAWKLAIETGPGPQIADNIIRPVLAFAGWVLL